MRRTHHNQNRGRGRRTLLVLLVAVVALAAAAPLAAQQRGGIGLGVVVGEPTGLSAISWLGGGNALVPATDFFLGGGVGIRFYF